MTRGGHVSDDDSDDDIVDVDDDNVVLLLICLDLSYTVIYTECVLICLGLSGFVLICLTLYTDTECVLICLDLSHTVRCICLELS